MSLNLIYSISKDLINWVRWKDQQKIVGLNWIEIPEVKKRICTNDYKLVWVRGDKVEARREKGWEVVYDFDRVKRIRFKIATHDGLILIKKRKE